MNGRIVWRVLLALVVAGAMVALGVYAYNAGIAQGLAQGAQVAGSESGAAPYPYYGPFVRPFGFGMGCFGLLVPLFLVFLIFGALRAMFWRGRRGWGMHHPDWGKGVPPAVEEWHRKLHETPPEHK